VGTEINNVRNNDPSLIEPCTDPEPAAEKPSETGSGQMEMFGD
jgi:hypothetical protein